MNHSTIAVRAGVEGDATFGSVIPPLYLSVNYAFEGFGKKRKYDYTRTANPTRDELATALAKLEFGAGAVVTSSGMSAVTLVLHLFQTGDLILAPHDCYGGTYRLLTAYARDERLRVQFINFGDSRALDAALAERPRAVWIESPSNPLLRVADIEYISKRAHAAGARSIVDNTFLSPALQNPIKLGADLVVHSTTKYINGHSDVVGGAVIAKDNETVEKLAWWANCMGVTGSPFDSYLTLRGLRTLFARMRVHEENAGSVARFLQKHPAVSNVYYPGLESDPGHALAKKQQLGFGAMLSFELNGGAPAAERFFSKLRCFSLAESLGGVESLAAHPATMTHASMDPAARARAGISDALVRLSVGIEAVEDLIKDLRSALEI
ncbi:MAG: cystathionine gamma-synthase [Planctomycetota bacterium]